LTFGWQLAEASNARARFCSECRAITRLDVAAGRRCHPAGSDAAGRFQNEAVNHMTIKAHLAELERQHKALEHEIAEGLAHSSSDDLKITELKRRKLILKDEIERVRHDHAL
jgi:hypothetical protein